MRLILPVIFPGILAIVAASLLTGCMIDDFGSSDRYRADFHYTLKPSDRLTVENANGEIEIEGWDNPSIEITGVRYGSTQQNLDAVKVDIHESTAVTEIRTQRPDMIHGNSGARYLIRAPRKTVLDRIVSSNGQVRVHDMTSEARIHTSNGAVRVENVAGGVDAQTSNGAIELNSVTGNLNLRTSNGRIHGDEITGACEAVTSNGPVELRFKDAPDGPVRINTSNGSVEVATSKPPRNGIRAETSNGSITVELPSNAAAHLNAETSHESVSSDFDIAKRSPSDQDKHHLEGNIGAGGPVIQLTTHNGGIHIRKSASSTN